MSDDGVYDGSGEMRGRRPRGARARARAGARRCGGRVSGQPAAAGHARRARACAATLSLAAPLPRRRGPRRPRGAPQRRRATAASRSTGRCRSGARRPGARRRRRRGAALRGGPRARRARRPASTPSCARSSRTLPHGARDRGHGRGAHPAGRSRRPAEVRGGGDARRARSCCCPTFPCAPASRCGCGSRRAGSSSAGSTSAARAPTSSSTARPTSLGDGPLAVSARGQRRPARARVAHAPLRGTRRRAARGRRLRAPARRRASRGTLDLEGAGLRVRGFPHGVEGLRGRVRFTERAAELEAVSGTLAGGPLTLEGQARLRGRASSPPTTSARSAAALALRYPEGLRSLLDAELRLFGDAEQQWVTGTVDVRQALYTQALRRRLRAPGRAPRAARARGRARGGRAARPAACGRPGTLRIDNNLATLAGARRPRSSRARPRRRS